MVFCGNYSFLKDNIAYIVKKTQSSSPEEKLTFIVHSNKMKTFLKEYLVKTNGILVNAKFYTLIDIAKEITKIEPLNDFEKKLIIKKFLVEKNIDLDSLSEELSDIIQLLKESKIDYEKIDDEFVKSIIKKYQDFLSENGYYDREDVFVSAINTKGDFDIGTVFIFGLKSIAPLHMDFLKKIKELSKNIYVFYPVIKDSGIYNNFIHLHNIIKFLENSVNKVNFQNKIGKNTVLAKNILRFDYEENEINPDIKILSFTDRYQEVEYIANEISNLLIEGEKLHQIGVVIPDVSKYIPYIKEVFPKYKIPYYLTEEKRYIDNQIYKKLLYLFKLKEKKFNKLSLLNILSKKLYNIENLEKLEKNIILSRAFQGFEDFEKFVFKEGIDENFFKLLTFVKNIPDNATFEEYLNLFNQLNEKFIKEQNVKSFLESTLQELSQSKLYKNLFKNLNYKDFIYILEEFFYREDKEKIIKGNLINILTPISAEANNFDYIYLLNLNSGEYPSVLKEETLINSLYLTGSSFPEHIIMYEILTFVNLLDDNKKITITYLSNPQNSPSFLLQDIKRLINYQEEKPCITQNSLKDFKIKYAKYIKEFDEKLNKKFQNITKKENYIIENFKIEDIKPIPAEDFSIYATCPYKFFLEKVIKIQDIEELDKKEIPLQEKEPIIEKIMEKFYKGEIDLENIKDNFFKEFKSSLDHILPYYRPFVEKDLEKLLEKLLKFLEYDKGRLKTKKIKSHILGKNYTGKLFEGKIKRIDEDEEGKFYIYDYKIEEKDINNIIKNNIHIVIYSALYESIEKKEIEEVGIFVINDENEKYLYPTNFQSKKKELLEFYKKMYFKITEKDFSPNKDNCKNCHFESFCFKNYPEEGNG